MNKPVYSLSQPYTPEQLEALYRDVVLKQGFYGANYGSHWSMEPYREVARVLQKVLAPQHHVDVGCAKGLLVAAMRELGIESYGVDFSEALVGQAPAAVRPFLTISRAEDWLERMVVSRADLLSFTDVFEHFPFAIIRKLLQELKPRFHGRIFLTLPSYGVDERVRTGLAIKEDTPPWQADMEANRPFRNIVLADGMPHHGHISHASYRWWTEFFLSVGWIRHHDLETAMMNFAQATFIQHRSSPYVLEQLEPAADSMALASTNRVGPGWHDIEGFEGHPGRWTNGNAQFFLTAQHVPRAIELELTTPPVNVIRDWYVLLSIERLVRPTPWSFEWRPLAVSPLVPLCQRGRRTTLTISLLTVPRHTGQNVEFTDVCRLNIISPRYVPCDYRLSEDRRPLGVIVHRLRIHHETAGNHCRQCLMNITPVFKNIAAVLQEGMTRAGLFPGKHPSLRSSRAPGGKESADDHFLLKQFPLRPDLPLPDGMNEEETFSFLNSIRVEKGPEEELAGYCRADWRRFLYTWGLVRDLSGTCLELGANPYFTTGLLREFTRLELSLANYFGPPFSALAEQKVRMVRRGSSESTWVTLPFHHFNIEAELFPFPDRHFDVLLFCEILEHLLADPIKVFAEIKRVLKPGGTLVLTTPNVARLENVARVIGGANIYDPYSGYGSYGRHNREYNRHELGLLLAWCGLEVEVAFTADVHSNHALESISKDTLFSLSAVLRQRQADLGQYIFLRARNSGPMKSKRPGWLYRSYPAGEIETC